MGFIINLRKLFGLNSQDDTSEPVPIFRYHDDYWVPSNLPFCKFSSVTEVLKAHPLATLISPITLEPCDASVLITKGY